MTQTTTKTSLLAVLVAAQACNPSSSIEDDIELGETEQAVYDPANPPAPVATDACDDDTYAATPYSSTASGHFVAYYIPGTAAETDLASIFAAREAAYGDITSKLGITTEPTISLYLSPSRLAAQAHSRGYGNAYPGLDRYEVVYTGAPGSFEMTRVGSLLARTLEFHVDSAKHIPIFSVGLAEVLDQSGRDLHDAYAMQLHAGVETRTRVNVFDSGDLNGKNIGRAASLTRFMIQRFGWATFVEMLKDTAVTSISGCSLKSATYGCINSTTALTAMLDGVIASNTAGADSWAAVAADWKAEVEASLATVKMALSNADKNAIENLVNLMDQAIETGDPDVYRSTMEGFYCEWLGDAGRAEIAARTIDSLQGSRSTIFRIYPTAAANFPAARALVMRADGRGVRSFHNLSLEKFPQGWRVTYGPDWW